MEKLPCKKNFKAHLTVFKKKAAMFTTSLLLSLLAGGFFYSMATVYVNAHNTLQAEKIEILHLTQTGWETGELSVVGRKYKFRFTESAGLPSWAYALLPPEIPLLYSAAEAIVDAAGVLE